MDISSRQVHNQENPQTADDQPKIVPKRIFFNIFSIVLFFSLSSLFKL